jgi:hypothetical protein
MTDAPNDRPAPPEARPKPRKRRALAWFLLLLLVAVFAAGVVLAPRIMAALPAWMTGGKPQALAAMPATVPPVPAPAAGDLPQRVDRLESTAARLESQGSNESAQSAEVAALRTQVGQLSTQINDLQVKLQELEETSPKALLKPMAVLALSRLRQAVEQGASYDGALDGARRLLDDAALPEKAKTALLTLDAHKSEGVASALALRDRFAASINDIIDAEAAPAGSSWWDRTLARLENMVTVRPTGDVKGTDAPAIAARAEAALNRGDVASAVREVQGLSPAAAVAAADWLQQAQTRLAVLGAVDTLETTALDSGTAGMETAP